MERFDVIKDICNHLGLEQEGGSWVRTLGLYLGLNGPFNGEYERRVFVEAISNTEVGVINATCSCTGGNNITLPYKSYSCRLKQSEPLAPIENIVFYNDTGISFNIKNGSYATHFYIEPIGNDNLFVNIDKIVIISDLSNNILWTKSLVNNEDTGGLNWLLLQSSDSSALGTYINQNGQVMGGGKFLEIRIYS